MSPSNGLVRIERKGRKKFAFGEEGTPGSEPFVVDVVNVFHDWLATVDTFRQEEENEAGERPIPPENREAYHAAAVEFVEKLRWSDSEKPLPDGYEKVSTGEAMDFTARLREAYDDLVVFTQPKSREERNSPATSGGSSELRFSVEPGPAPENSQEPAES